MADGRLKGKMTIERKFSTSVAWMAAGNWTEQAVNFAVFVTLARLLGAEAYGLLAMASVFIVLSESLVRESLSEYLIAAADPSPEDFNAVFWLLAGLGLLLALVLVLAAGPIARGYGQPEVRGLIMALSPTVVLIALTAVPVAILRRELRFRILALRATAGVIGGGIVGIAMAVAGYGVWSFVGQWISMITTNIVMAWGAVDWRPGWRFGRGHLGRAAGFGGQVLSLRAAELAATQTPMLIIGATLGPVAAGLYSVAWRLVETLSFLIVTPLRMASQPAFAAISREGGRAGGLLVDISRLTGLAAFPFFAGLAVLAGPIVDLVFGTEWLPAAPVLSVLAFMGPYFCIAKVQQSFCLAAGRAGPITLLAWAGVGLGAAMVLVAAAFGLLAIAVAFVASHYLLWGLRFRVVARLADLPVAAFLSCHLRPLGASAIMAVAVVLVARETAGAAPVVRVAISVAAGVVVFAGLTLGFMRDRLRLLISLVAGPREIPDNNG